MTGWDDLIILGIFKQRIYPFYTEILILKTAKKPKDF